MKIVEADIKNKKIVETLDLYRPIKNSADIEHYSISSILEQIKPEFEKEKVAQKTFEKNFNNPDSKYYQKTVEEILEMWKASGTTSTSNGSLLDDYIGLLLNDESTELWEMDNLYNNDILKHKCQLANSFIESLKTNNFHFVCREKEVFCVIEENDKKYIIHGRFDALFSYVINDIFYLYLIDWKNTEKIEFTNKFKTLLGPCKNYDDANGILYLIQLFFYKYCLEETYKVGYPINISIVQFPTTDTKIYSSNNFKFDNNQIREILLFGIKKIKLKKELKKQEKRTS